MSVSDLLRHVGRSPAFKFTIICFLILALIIPLLFVWALTSDRSGYAKRAKRDVEQMWARSQVVRGPFVIVPVIENRELRNNGKVEIQRIRKTAVLLPEMLNLNVDVQTKELTRGIFQIPVYRSKIDVSGHFKKPDLNRISNSANEVLWAEAILSVLISDVRGIKKTAEITLDNGVAQKFRAGVGLGDQRTQGIHLPLDENQAQNGFPFSFTLDLNGTSDIGFVPAGGETMVKASSNWPHPSFTGAFLPETRKISDTGFEARWEIPRLARSYDQVFIMANLNNPMQDNIFRVRFYQPADFYNLVDRSLKYAIGFIAIAFLAVFVLEIQSYKPVHWIQYVFVGLALIIFYLVLLGLSEHLGFETAYALASVATSLLIGIYAMSAFKSFFKGATLFFVLALIYGLLYLLLRVEDYAMLIGSLAAFSLLSIVMFATRNVDWGRSIGNESNQLE